MTYTEPKQQTTNPLTYAERCNIASVLTWDSLGKAFSPDEILAIRIDGDMVNVKLTRDRSYPIPRNLFRSILCLQREAAVKQIEAIVEVEATEVILQHNEWLAQPIGTNPDCIFGIAPNGYHNTEWTSDGCEF